MTTDNPRPGRWGRLAPRPYDQIRWPFRGQFEWPFCGDEYPPLKDSPGTVVCTKPRHPDTEMHLNEETGWVWPSGLDDQPRG